MAMNGLALAPFAMDIRPIGITRRHLAEKYDISSEADFLKFGANNPSREFENSQSLSLKNII